MIDVPRAFDDPKVHDAFVALTRACGDDGFWTNYADQRVASALHGVLKSWTSADIDLTAAKTKILELVDAFAKVRADHPEARLTIAGEGPMRDEVRARAVGHGLGDVVEMPGFVDGIAGLGDVDVIAQLSVWENCSYTILDAHALAAA